MNYPFFGAYGAPYFHRHSGPTIMEIMMLSNHHRCYSGYRGCGPGYQGYPYHPLGFGCGYGGYGY